MQDDHTVEIVISDRDDDEPDRARTPEGRRRRRS
jgi:hypothetical protein